jgi:hypothetical protein
LLELLEDGTAFVIKAVGRCLYTLSHLLQLVFLSTAMIFIPNKQSPALSLSVDCPPLFGIKGLQECSQLLELLEDGTAFMGNVAGRCLHTLSCGFSFLVVDLFYWWKNYDSNAWVLFQVEAAKYLH